MKLSKFDYNLPRELIAQKPTTPRDHSRLLILDQNNENIKHKKFYNIIEYLKSGDVLILNNSRVFPARLIGKRKKTNGKIEVFLLRNMLRNKDTCKWQCLVGGKRIRVGLEIEFDKKIECVLKKDNKDSTWEVEFNLNNKAMMSIVNEIGSVPLPPYIKREKQKRGDKKNYQTVYADENKIGSVAAPTAGFHFTPELLKKIKAKGIQIEYITLHVGLGTFAPVKTDDITKHKMHAEFVEIKKSTIDKIKKGKKENKKIIAVGTTSVRSLESFFNDPKSYKLTANSYSAWVDIFIYPGYKFKIVDAMITNFHLPKSTLLMLVSAMAGKEKIKKAYKSAVNNSYRFYSYGDAMFIK